MKLLIKSKSRFKNREDLRAACAAGAQVAVTWDTEEKLEAARRAAFGDDYRNPKKVGPRISISVKAGARRRIAHAVIVWEYYNCQCGICDPTDGPELVLVPAN